MTSVASAAAAAVVTGCTSSAAYTLYSENDLYGLGNRDRHYTNGIRLTGLHPADATPAPVHALAEAFPAVSENATSQVGWVVGQDMYTPADIRAARPDPDDRPYGGWLYVGVLVAKAVRADDGPQGDFVDVLEVDVGVVGPPSRAEEAQVSIHNFVGSPRPRGWDHQLRFEPGLAVQVERRHRLWAGGSIRDSDWDVLGTAGVTAGNVFTHASVGGIFRWGSDLRRDFGPNTIHSTAVDVPDVAESARLRWYTFGGAEGRGVLRNLFLDGNSFRDSPSVDREHFLAVLRAGVVVEWGLFRLGYTHVFRTREFETQRESQAFGSLALTYQLNF